jgi:N-acyl-D-aspartate/D-glutamate deacylase
MGDAAYEREATTEEIAQMQAVLRDALEAGAAGFATSFALTHRGIDGLPVPSRFAAREEFDALLDTLGEVGRGVLMIAPGDQCHIDDLYDLQPRIGVPFTYGALLSSANGGHHRSVALNNDGWARGAQVWPQVSPRPLMFAMTMASPFILNMNPEFGALMSGSLDDRRRAYEDPAWRARALEPWAGRGPGFGVPDWDKYTIVESSRHSELLERTVNDVAAERGQEPFDALLDLALEEPDLALRVRSVVLNDDPDEVGKLLLDEHCTLGLSDAGAHVGQLCDAPAPTDFLGNWVRDRSLMPIETAVRKLTGTQADLLGLADRGYLREGAWADVVVFDLDTVAPGPLRRVRDFPADAERLTADEPSGVRHVVVNGTPVRVDGVEMADGDARPGQVVRPAVRVH